MEIKEAKEILRAGYAWANWTAEQKEAMKIAYDSMELVEKLKKENKHGLMPLVEELQKKNKELEEEVMMYRTFATILRNDLDKFYEEMDEIKREQ